MFTNVLIGIDGKQGGRDAIALASRLADTSAKFTLAHVIPGRLRPIHAVSPALIREEREASRTLLEHERTTAGIDAELLSIEALSPGRGLHEQAEQRQADLLVVGSCSRGLLGRAMLGDDARASLNGAPCAVAIAAAGYAEHPRPFAKIGVGYNPSPESESAVEAARELAAPTNAQVCARQIVPLQFGYLGMVTPITGELIDDALKHAENEMADRLPDVQRSVVGGMTGEELAAFGDEMDLLLLGSRRYGPTKRLVLGSTSHYLQRHARCSLLVLSRPASDPMEATDDSEQERAEASVASAV